MVVKAELTTLGLHPLQVDLGEEDVAEDDLGRAQLDAINAKLGLIGFELIEDRKARVAEQIKTVVIALIHRDNDDSPIKHSEYLAQQTGLDYPYLSKVFSEEEGTTI